MPRVSSPISVNEDDAAEEIIEERPGVALLGFTLLVPTTLASVLVRLLSAVSMDNFNLKYLHASLLLISAHHPDVGLLALV